MKCLGRAIALVEQNVAQALDVSDRFVVIERGRVVLAGTAASRDDRDKLMATLAV
jgi:branched-chain amino acid transport system ATP-binding protein